MKKLSVHFLLMLSMVCLTPYMSCRLMAAETYKVGVEAQDYAPFSYVQGGEFKGLIRDVLDKFAASKGYQFKYEPYPIPRLFRAYLEGRVDLKFPDHPNWASDQKQTYDIHYSARGIPAMNGVLTLDGNQEAPPSEIKRVGTVLGFTTPELKTLAERGEIDLYEVNKLDNLLRMLRKRHVRGVYFDANVARFYMKQQSATDLKLNELFPYTLFEYRLSSILHPKLTKEFDAFLAANQPWFQQRLKHYDIRQR